MVLDFELSGAQSKILRKPSLAEMMCAQKGQSPCERYLANSRQPQNMLEAQCIPLFGPYSRTVAQ